DRETAARGEHRSFPGVRQHHTRAGAHHEKPARGARRPATARVNPRADAHVPHTKCITGPKLRPAGAPRKWSPGTDDSKPAERTGGPPRVRTRPTSSGARKR